MTVPSTPLNMIPQHFLRLQTQTPGGLQLKEHMVWTWNPMVFDFGVEPVWKEDSHGILNDLLKISQILSFESVLGAPNSKESVGCG